MDKDKLKIEDYIISRVALANVTAEAREILSEGAMILEKLGFKCWVSAGTVLGLYRDGELIPHDTDVDVEVLMTRPAKSNENLIDGAFKSFEFVQVRKMHYDGNVMQLAYIKKQVVFDIYFFYDDEVTNLVNYNDGGTYRLKKSFVEELKEYKGLPFPDPIEDYLEWRYGKDWKTPTDGKGTWHDDCACLQK